MNFVEQNITITANEPLVINGENPEVLEFGQLTMEEGGEIHFLTNVTMNVQTATFKGNNKIKFIGTDGRNAPSQGNALRGGDGGNSPTGVLRFGSVSGYVEICILAGKGGDGGPGNPTGGVGGRGGNGMDVTVMYQTLEANSGFTPVTPKAPGGKGGPGAKGADGTTDTGNDGLPGLPGQVSIMKAN